MYRAFPEMGARVGGETGMLTCSDKFRKRAVGNCWEQNSGKRPGEGGRILKTHFSISSPCIGFCSFFQVS